MKKVLIIDNYDSFVYNLYQYVKEIFPQAETMVYRNDALDIDAIRNMAPTHIIVSPGPGRPENAGVTIEAIKVFSQDTPILGVCLGHQAIGAAFGARVIHASKLVHGKTSQIQHTEAGILYELANPFTATRYHSLALEEKSLPECLTIIAKSEDDNEIMAVQLKDKPVYGVQFHPESILTGEGKKIMKNFLDIEKGADIFLSVKPLSASRGTVQQGLSTLFSGQDLSLQETESIMEEIMTGKTSDAQIAAFLTALRMKGESGDELAGMALVMRNKAIKVRACDPRSVDTCGTGGDGAHTCNISTAASFVVSAAGISVAKHGNRSVSSKVGSADVLEAGGYRLQKTSQEMEQELAETGFTFMFAPLMHPAMKHVMPVRRQLKTRTAFNLLGPVTNPARVKYQLIGIFDFAYASRLARALQAIGTERSMIVCGGFTDELTTCAENKALLVTRDSVEELDININVLGLETGSRKELEGEEDPQRAFYAIEQILSARANQTQIETVALNAGALFYITKETATLKDGVEKALQLIRSGQAADKLRQVIGYQKDTGEKENG